MTKKIITLIFMLSIFNTIHVKSQNNKKKICDEDGKLMTEFSISIINGDTLYNGANIGYYPNGEMKDSCFFKNGIKIGKEVFYDKKGRMTIIHEFKGETFPRLIKTKAYYYSGSCRYVEDEMIEKSQGSAVKEGVIKHYWKNMQIMDSAIFVNNKKVYRARFSKKGEFQFENKY